MIQVMVRVDALTDGMIGAVAGTFGGQAVRFVGLFVQIMLHGG